MIARRRASPITALFSLPMLSSLVMMAIRIGLVMIIIDGRHGFRASMISPRMVLLNILGSVLVVVFPFVVSLIASGVNVVNTLWWLWW